jgi:ubiquinone/menaquinone biosynthesis C-methylase UbiE
MTKEQLREILESLSHISNDEWLSSLDKRKLIEHEFHNRDRDKELIKQLPRDIYEQFHGNKKFYSTAKLSYTYVDDWIRRHSKGRVFLDYACGNGPNAIKAAKAGADFAIGMDISSVSIQNAKNCAEKEGVSANTYFILGDCENTKLPNECIDVCVCSGMLHHLDLSIAFNELRRILRPKGVILAIESLKYNPLIRLYRNLTPQMRTKWEKEHILSYKDLTFAKNFFTLREVKHWHLFSIAGAYFPHASQFLNMIDSFVLNVPFIKFLSWMFTFELHKKE